MLKWKVNSHLSSADLDSSLYSSIAGSEESLVDCFNTNLREMMQELQVGFSAAMTELSNIQDEDKKLHEKLNNSKQEQEVQMKDILNVILTLKAQCDDIQYQIEVSNKNQRKLEKEIKKLKAERQVQSDEMGGRRHVSMLDGLTTAMVSSQRGDNPDVYTSSPMLKSFIASLPLPAEMEEIEDHHSDSDESLAAVTQKSLMLTNALAQRAYDDNQQSAKKLTTDASADHHSSEISSKGELHPTGEYFNGCLPDDRKLPTKHNPNVINRLQVQRQRIAISIVDSERNYCTTLYNIIESYSKVLKDSGVLSARDSSRIFPTSLTSIYEYHCTVLKRLESRILRWRQQDILGDIFGKFSVTKQVDIFAQYRDYIDNFAAALRTVRKLNKTSEGFRSTLKRCQREAGGDNLSLISQLLAPVRRIPSLVLYIKKLLKYTDADHPDRFFLESSLANLRSNLLSMNEAMERSIQIAASDGNSSKRSSETCSWSSHEEDQRLSTATKDSGIHSNCDVESHEEFSTASRKQRENHSATKRNLRYSENSSLRKQLPPRPRSMLDFTREEPDLSASLPRRCKTPTIGGYGVHRAPLAGSQKPQLPLKPSLSHSTPNLLDDLAYSDTNGKPQGKTKHKVQFKNPPEEHNSNSRTHPGKRLKKRSIADTLRIIFNRRKSGQSKNSNSDISDSCCDLNSSIDEGGETPQPAPPQMFANGGRAFSTSHLPTTHEEGPQYLDNDTYEDENGDPYSVV